MRVILIGQEAFGRACLEALLDQGETVVGVVTVPEIPGAKPNPVRQLAEEKDIRCLQPRRLKEDQVYEWVRALEPDLLVLAYVTQFVPGRLIRLARRGGINYHPSLLPKYRGGTAINWAIIRGERETGVTIHWLDEGVDTGDILLQRKVEIGPDDTAASLYFNKLFPLGVEMIAEAVKLVREGKAPRIKQDDALASFQPVIKDKDTGVDWFWPARRVHDLVRGAAPRPGAWTTWAGRRVRVWESALPAARGGNGHEPGRVLEVGADGALVATGAGAVLLKRLGEEGGPKLAAADFAAQAGLAPGHRLGAEGERGLEEMALEVRWHARGGQGAVLGSRFLAAASLREGKYFQAFPQFGTERMGAPIVAFTRVGPSPVHTHCAVTEPDAVVVLDHTLLGQVDVTAGLKPEGTVVVNFPGSVEELRATIRLPSGARAAVVDATRISREEMGRAIPNTPMVGALARVTGVVAMDNVLAEFKEGLGARFSPEVVEANLRAIRRAYEEVQVG